MKTKIMWLRISYWVGAILDGLYVIPMLSTKVGGTLYKIEDFNPGVEYRYAMAVGAAMMLGWTFLLVWADCKPVERRGVLLLTIFPVKVSLDLASIYPLAYGIITLNDYAPSLVISFLLYVLFIYSYVNSRDLVKTNDSTSNVPR